MTSYLDRYSAPYGEEIAPVGAVEWWWEMEAEEESCGSAFTDLPCLLRNVSYHHTIFGNLFTAIHITSVNNYICSTQTENIKRESMSQSQRLMNI